MRVVFRFLVPSVAEDLAADFLPAAPDAGALPAGALPAPAGALPAAFGGFGAIFESGLKGVKVGKDSKSKCQSGEC